MLKSYKYLQSDHSKLHEFIVAFFNRIENETGKFKESFFDPDFKPIADRHRKIIKQRCKDIYEIIKTWPASKRSSFCEAVRSSNDIKGICEGTTRPLRIDQIPPDIRELIKDLFIDLYEQVLDGNAFTSRYKTLKDHFKEFKEINSNITLCPICGISPLKTQFDTSRDQYDHYFPKMLYPLSSVNFKNLVPICSDCNCPTCKGATDPVAVTTGKLFYPYEENYQGINIKFKIITDNVKIDDIEWAVDFTSPGGRREEIQAWRSIYHIDDRYKGFVKGRIKQWYTAYWEFIRPMQGNAVKRKMKQNEYMRFLQSDKDNLIDHIRKPALEAYLEGSVLSQATMEARQYS